MASKGYETAKRYYPTNMSKEKLVTLVSKGHLTKEEFLEITNENYIDSLSLEELKEVKISEMKSKCSNTIYSGIDVTTTLGTEHFGLQETDQINITTLYNSIAAGTVTEVYYHSDGKLCRSFSAEEFSAIALGAQTFVTYNTTLLNHIISQINSLTTKESVVNIIYDASTLTGEYATSFTNIITNVK